jgi:translocation and assembly module TamB
MLLFLALVLALAVWLLASQAGSRLLVTTAAEQFGGIAEGVQGSVLEGLQVGRLRVQVGGAAIDLADLRLQVAWRELFARRLHVRELAVGAAHVALVSEPATVEKPSVAGGDFRMPLEIAVDRLAVGEFSLLRDGQPLPVALGGLEAKLSAGAEGAQLSLAGLHVGHALAQTDLQGDVRLSRLAQPWPFEARLMAAAQGEAPDSPLCLDKILNRYTAATAAPKPAADMRCAFVVTAHAQGSLDAVTLDIAGEGSGLTVNSQAELAPGALSSGVGFPLRRLRLDLRLADKSGLAAALDWQTKDVAGVAQDQVSGTLDSQDLDLSRLLGPGVPPARLSAGAVFDVALEAHERLQRARLAVNFAPGSKWNNQALAGKIALQLLAADAASASPGRASAPQAGTSEPARGAAASPSDAPAAAWAGYSIDQLDIDLTLGRNRVLASGNLGAVASSLKLKADAPQLEAFWPGLSGGASLQGEVAGTLASHRGAFQARYAPAKPQAGKLGQSPAEAAMKFAGGWGPGAPGRPDAALEGWRGNLSSLTGSHAGFSLNIAQAIDLSFLPAAAAPLWQWQVGAATLVAGMPNQQRFTFAHAGSRGGPGRWQTAGRLDNAVISADLVRSIMAAIDPEAARQQAAQQKRINGNVAEASRRIALDTSWDLAFDGALSGRAGIVRRSGDLLIPGDPPVPLGLRRLALDLTAKPAGAGSSRVDAKLDAQTAKMGAIAATGSAVLGSKAGPFTIDPAQIRAHIDADIADLGFVGLFTGDSMEVGGALKANVDVAGAPGGEFHSTGTVNGSKLRLVRLDDGVRMMDGTLSLRLADDTVYLDSLRFPAALRVMPDEWRTKTWITEDAGAKGGYIEARGQWQLSASKGAIHIDVHRFPALQRSDRYAMISGGIDIDAALPRINITGDLKADAGWVSLEILQSVPTLDDDVHVMRAGDKRQAAGDAPIRLGMNLKFDLGPRFYITGMGLDAGLVGNIQILLEDGKLSGEGQLRTRGGRIEAYGQKLQLRRGTLTFQGKLDNPILDIEALRTGAQVEAGVRVAGTAQRPRIDLVSYPDVSDVEKLSWLVLGRGPAEGGNDAALLLSAGAALLGGGQPFYRQFGLDDVSVRSGAIGSSGSLLPDRTVASSVNRDSDSDLATQFLVASKNLANGITLSVEQAMSGAGTVGRASYKLSRNWSVDLKGGTVNGLSLVYRILSRE